MKVPSYLLEEKEDTSIVSKNGLKRIIHKMGVEIFTIQRLPHGLNHFIDAIREGELIDPKIIFDVGANIGQTSTHLRNAFNKSEIYAFEPVGSTYAELIKNTQHKNIKAYRLGFGEEKGNRKVFLQEKSILNSLVESLNIPDDPQMVETVEITTIDSFCIENQIDRISLLKIDTEGFGLKVLAGAEGLLKQGRIESIFIEVGFNENDQRHDYFHNVHQMLSNSSFQLFGFYNQWIENSRLEYCNAFFVLPK